jgi:outer membrane murein-binding lipoprotein Lpp
MRHWRDFLHHGDWHFVILEFVMASQADLDAKLDQIAAKVDDLKAQIAALGNPPAPPVSQAELDADVAKADAILAK